MYLIKDAKGVVRAKADDFGEAKRKVRSDWTIWFRSALTRTVETTTVHRKDKVSRVHGKVASARVGGQHSAVVLHKVETGRYVENRIW